MISSTVKGKATTFFVEAEKEISKKTLLGFFKLHFRRIMLEIINFFFNHDWFFKIIGWFNKKYGLIKSIFLAYPATEDYALAYGYPKRIEKNRWTPWLSGVLKQNGGLAIMFSISAHNGQFTDPQNIERLHQIAERMERLRQLLGAEGKTFAGILPGIFYLKRIIHEAPEADLTAVAVSQAIDLVRAEELLPDETPIIVLGGKGFIGRRVVKLLDKSITHSIDSVDGHNQNVWPVHLRGERVIVVNITLKNALNDYLDSIWPGTVVINEVYPEPMLNVLAKLRSKGCNCYHIVGIEAKAFPRFPGAYEGAIPCCAAWPSSSIKTVVRKIN